MKALSYSTRVSLLGASGRYLLTVGSTRAAKIVSLGHGDPIVKNGIVKTIQIIAPAFDDSARSSRHSGLGLGGTKYVYRERVGQKDERPGFVFSFTRLTSGVELPEDSPEKEKINAAIGPFVQVLQDCLA